MTDAVALTRELVKCRSVTPADAGAIPLMEKLLAANGFRTTRIERGGILNLFARWGDTGSGPTLGFNGHTDVVPEGDPTAWSHAPYAADIVDGILYGRGTSDMKSGLAAFASAAIDYIGSGAARGSIVMMLTGDEEGDAQDGTRAILDWMAAQDERVDHCIVGEPTCPSVMGEMMKIGRRGSMTAYFTVTGKQGHAAYPQRARNPLPALARLVDRLSSHPLDGGTALFDPSTLTCTTIDTGNTANNVIPEKCRATVNIRFNDAHSSTSLTAYLRAQADSITADFDVQIDLRVQVSGESFYTPPGEFSQMVADAVLSETGVTPEMSTSGGTSDARFIRAHCPVVEFGLVGKTMHQVDEHVEVAHIQQLTAIYRRIIGSYFSN